VNQAGTGAGGHARRGRLLVVAGAAVVLTMACEPMPPDARAVQDLELERQRFQQRGLSSESGTFNSFNGYWP